jgi:hypothetical protein
MFEDSWAICSRCNGGWRGETIACLFYVFTFAGFFDISTQSPWAYVKYSDLRSVPGLEDCTLLAVNIQAFSLYTIVYVRFAHPRAVCCCVLLSPLLAIRRVLKTVLLRLYQLPPRQGFATSLACARQMDPWSCTLYLYMCHHEQQFLQNLEIYRNYFDKFFISRTCRTWV